MNRSNRIKNMVTAALCIALGLVLPFLTGQIPQIGRMLSPMHIPVFLCGFLCGWQWGLLAGCVTPLLRAVLFGMPALFPQAVAMAFELAVYGGVTGFLYPRLKTRNLAGIYMTLIAAMIAGRIVWGLVSFVIYGISGSAFTFELFLAGAFINAIPGIILHLVIVPPLVMALRKVLVTDDGVAHA